MEITEATHRDDQSWRSIVSYVRRSPRMTPSQRAWMDTYGPTWILDVAHGAQPTSVAVQPLLDLTAVFGREAPVIAEIGCGHGETLVAAAAKHPGINFLGFEVFEASLASTLGKIAAAGVTNVRLIDADAVSGFIHLLPDHALTELWIFFPDPWPKKRHHKRRLVSPAFATIIADKLVDHGMARLATDWSSYALSMRKTLGADSRFTLESTDRFPGRPITKFEARGIEAGRTIYDFAFQVSHTRTESRADTDPSESVENTGGPP